MIVKPGLVSVYTENGVEAFGGAIKISIYSSVERLRFYERAGNVRLQEILVACKFQVIGDDWRHGDFCAEKFRRPVYYNYSREILGKKPFYFIAVGINKDFIHFFCRLEAAQNVIN